MWAVFQSPKESTPDRVAGNKRNIRDVESDETTSSNELDAKNRNDGTCRQSSKVHADKHIRRILDVYFEAKKDFYDLKDADYLGKVQAARFLRDTAENALNCFRSRGLMSHRMVPELERMFQFAKDKATEFLGGKKRRFEIKEDPRTAAKRRHHTRHRYASPYMRP
jgi:hypothetical protein